MLADVKRWKKEDEDAFRRDLKKLFDHYNISVIANLTAGYNDQNKFVIEYARTYNRVMKPTDTADVDELTRKMLIDVALDHRDHEMFAQLTGEEPVTPPDTTRQGKPKFCPDCCDAMWFSTPCKRCGKAICLDCAKISNGLCVECDWKQGKM